MNVFGSDTQVKGARLWVDGVGGYLVSFVPELVLGNPQPIDGSAVKAAIGADLYRNHAAIFHEIGSIALTSEGPATVNGQLAGSGIRLRSPSTIKLGDVELSFRVPSPLSPSGIVTLTSPHRFNDGTDGAILFRKTCLLGPDPQNHIVCEGWSTNLIFYENGDQLKCRVRSGELFINEELQPTDAIVQDNDYLSGADWSVRIEFLMNSVESSQAES